MADNDDNDGLEGVSNQLIYILFWSSHQRTGLVPRVAHDAGILSASSGSCQELVSAMLLM